MLIHKVHTKHHTWRTLFPYKRSLQPVGPSSFTLLGWFRLPPIDQYSSLLPPVGVWTVSQFQCGDLPLRTPTHRRLGGPLPRQQANGTHPHPLPINLYLSLPCGKTNTSGIKLPFRRLSRSKGQVGYALLTRAPVAIKPSKAGSMLPLDLHVLSL